ncbi:Aldehyde dehydrogenase [Planctomycetes bacterium K23_9]|uniref:Aldehyde dehydrogenase n=2 Tax=Stieleria marina TaxID=1930275 RepID=A0A517NXC8_9BACT|nr:Aldehyde dehydrogenase [Planctomycetes bacterium K23_9]
MGRAANEIQLDSSTLVDLCRSDQRVHDLETISAELLPLCAALDFLHKNAAKILRSRACGILGRPSWLWGVRSRVYRRPHGTVLILGPWNYPLFLVGVQTAQALVAGNRVLLKPAPGCEASTTRLAECFFRAGVSREQLTVLDSSVSAATEAIESGVDLVVLTGGVQTGRKVMAQLAQTLTPSIMELSGCDAVIVLPDADLQLVAQSIDFGLNFNGGATCIGPRRLFVLQSMAAPVIEAICDRLADRESVVVHPSARESAAQSIERALAGGACNLIGDGTFDAALLRQSGVMRPVVLDGVASTDDIANADIFAPVISIVRIDYIEQAVAAVNRCDLRLAASVFGPPAIAMQLALQLEVGNVTVNDLIAPTADPRLPFGGRGQSGLGSTRGQEGLLAMTTPLVISQRRGSFTPHLDRPTESQQKLVSGILTMLHAPKWGARLRGLRDIMRSVKK